MDDIPYSRFRVIYMLHPCAIGFGLQTSMTFICRKWHWWCCAFCCPLLFQNFSVKLFSNKADTSCSDFCFTDTVSFVEGVSEVEFQHAQNLSG